MKELYEKIDKVLMKYEYDTVSLIPILMEIQEVSDGNYISKEVAKYISKKLGTSMNSIFEILTFYSALNEKKKGKNIIQLCDSTVCRVNNNYILREVLEEELNIAMGETTEDGLFTLEYSSCFGGCDISPAIRINDIVYGNLNREKISNIISELRGEKGE